MRPTASFLQRLSSQTSRPYFPQKCCCPWLPPVPLQPPSRRTLQTTSAISPRIPDFAFAFDIDGVLLRSSTPIPRARSTLLALQRLRIPFILLTNGGGKHDADRVRELSHLLSVPIPPSAFIQSHTPFASLTTTTAPSDPTGTPLAEKTILVTGGDGERCRKVAEAYGFRSVVIPADIITAQPDIWPFTSPQNHAAHARPLPLPIYNPSTSGTSPPSEKQHLTIHSVFVFNDPRDWALDTQLLLDILLSDRGILGTTAPSTSQDQTQQPQPQQQQQPPLYFSNPDLLWSSRHHHPRLGQGAFLASFLGVWAAVAPANRPLNYTTIGKPSQSTFAFAETRLLEHRRQQLLDLSSSSSAKPENRLRKVYMVGDNPSSDILGGNAYVSPNGSEWETVLVRSGVYDEGRMGPPQHTPSVVVEDVWEGVEWALGREGCEPLLKHGE
ncbi:MAG: hypothetical protein LQ345_001270 [Seirophora villosa]|nr:MAG: hypothetical protein LQ345_001270 [Seirophora villosa]